MNVTLNNPRKNATALTTPRLYRDLLQEVQTVTRDRDDPEIGKELARQAREHRTMPRWARDQE